jgi:hypothetical protein
MGRHSAAFANRVPRNSRAATTARNSGMRRSA